jgi:hypothetical protein
LESWNNGIVEKWKKGIKIRGLFFHHSNIPAFHFSIARLLLRQGHDDVGVPGAIEV